VSLLVIGAVTICATGRFRPWVGEDATVVADAVAGHYR